MPSQRKRIGFLPREEVQKIIDQICQQNKLSQSKVTGILVEEALSYRGVLKYDSKDKTESLIQSYNNFFLNKNEGSYNEVSDKNHNINLDDSYINDEVRMINEFIEFKIFKNIIKQNKILDISVTR